MLPGEVRGIACRTVAATARIDPGVAFRIA